MTMCLWRRRVAQRRPAAVPPIFLPSIVSVLLVLLTACATRYTPEVRLPSSETTIDAVAEWHSLQLAPTLLSGHDTYGVLGPKVSTPSPKELTQQVEAAIVDELARHGVFTRLTRFDPHPDLIVSGRLDAFYEHYRPQLWTYAPGASIATWLFRLNNYVSSGEAALTLVVLKATGEPIAEYTGRERFRETLTPNGEMPPGTRLNHAFSQALQQIRDRMLKDERLSKLTRTATGGTRR